MPRRAVSKGHFLPVPTAFDGTPEGLADVLKLEFMPQLKVSMSDEANRVTEQTFSMAPTTHKALIDLAALDMRDLDFGRLRKDCELVQSALSKHRAEIDGALELVTGGEVSVEAVRRNAAALAEAGLTEEGFRERGGGLIGLVAVVVAMLVMGSCAHCAPFKKPDPPH